MVLLIVILLAVLVGLLLTELRSVADDDVETDTAHQNFELRERPDSRLTPGDIDPNATKEKVCTSGYTATVRDVSTRTKREVYKAYGIKMPVRKGAYEVDHFIPLVLGGSNSQKNLWPQPADPRPGFHEKDVVENYLHHEVCGDRVTLEKAQHEIRTDWYAVYERIDGHHRKR